MCKGIYELYCQCDKVSWASPGFIKLMQDSILMNTQTSQQQTLPQVEDSKSVELGDTDCNGSLKAAEGEDVYQSDKEEWLCHQQWTKSLLSWKLNTG